MILCWIVVILLSCAIIKEAKNRNLVSIKKKSNIWNDILKCLIFCIPFISFFIAIALIVKSDEIIEETLKKCYKLEVKE